MDDAGNPANDDDLRFSIAFRQQQRLKEAGMSGDRIGWLDERTEYRRDDRARREQCLYSGLVLDLDFDSGVPSDISGFGHSVSIENSTPTFNRFSAFNQAWNFQPNVNSRLVVPPSNDLIFTDAMSVSMYVRFNQPWTYHAESLAWKFQSPSTDSFQLSVDQNNAGYGQGCIRSFFNHFRRYKRNTDCFLL